MSGKDEKIQLLEARISALERGLELLLKASGIDMYGLRDLSATQLLEYYRQAVSLLGLRELFLTDDEIEEWAKIFNQLSEIECTKLQTLVEYDHTWEPFYELCLRLQASLRRRPSFAIDPVGRELYALLEKGRKNLQAVAAVCMKNDPQQAPYRAQILLKDFEDYMPRKPNQ